MKTQINFWGGKKSLEYEVKTIKEAVELAVKDGASLVRASLVRASLDGANLDGANLYGANLDGANLDGASLVRASLVRASLDGANLVRANLDGANLDGANLYGANLDGANLDGASLDGASLDGAKITLINLPHQKYSVLVIDDNIKIGWELHTLNEWNKFTNKEILKMDGKEALKWWKEHKPVIIPLAKLHIKKLKEISKPKKD